MPQAWSSKDERQYEHIKDSAKKEGRSAKRAKADRRRHREQAAQVGRPHQGAAVAQVERSRKRTSGSRSRSR